MLNTPEPTKQEFGESLPNHTMRAGTLPDSDDVPQRGADSELAPEIPISHTTFVLVEKSQKANDQLCLTDLDCRITDSLFGICGLTSKKDSLL